MSRFLSVWILLLLGVALNSVIAVHQQGGQAEGLPGCSLSGFRCDEVLASPYGRLFGFPLAWWGWGYYFALAALLVAVRRADEVPARLLVTVATVPGVVTAVWLIVVMKSQIGSFCLWCLAVHAVNATLFFVAVYQAQTTWERAVKSAPQQPPYRRSLVWASIVAGAALAGSQMAMLVLGHDPIHLAVVPIADIPDPLARLSIASDTDQVSTVVGNPDGTQTLVVFSCPTCRHCRKVHEMLTAINARAGERYRLEIRFAPLSSKCNPTVPVASKTSLEHQNSCELTELALAVATAAPSQFAGYLDWLFAHQEGMTARAAREEAIRRVGRSKLDAAMRSDEIDRRLETDVALAGQFDVKSVPQIFVRGGRITGTLESAALERLLDEQGLSHGTRQ